MAGTFYPGSPTRLRSMISDFLSNVEKFPVDGKIIALIAPHAGYMYSGQVAAYAYKQIEGMHFDTILLIGVSHRAPVRGASVYRGGGYETPLGIVDIDANTASELIAQSEVFSFQPNADAMEHSVEVQVPFLQVVLSDFKIVPILMGHYSKALCSSMSDAIANVMRDKNAIIVASTDMSHYYPYTTAVNLDNVALSSIKRLDVDQLIDDLDSGDCELCGAGPVITTLMASKKLGANNVQILKYANSGDVTGDRSEVVGYFSAMIYQSNR